MTNKPKQVEIAVDPDLGALVVQLQDEVADIFARIMWPRVKAAQPTAEDYKKAGEAWTDAAAAVVWAVVQKQADRNHGGRQRPVLLQALRDQKKRRGLVTLCQLVAAHYANGHLNDASSIQQH